jgi:hypothetical protein
VACRFLRLGLGIQMHGRTRAGRPMGAFALPRPSRAAAGPCLPMATTSVGEGLGKPCPEQVSGAQSHTPFGVSLRLHRFFLNSNVGKALERLMG